MTQEWHEQWREFVERIDAWAQMYPTSMFPNIDMRDIEKREHSYAETMSIGHRNAARMARHVLTRLLEDVRALDTELKEDDA